MNYERWKDLAELIGVLSIVASLVFVGLQLKQSQDIALAAQYNARAAVTQDMYVAHLESGYDPAIGLSKSIDEMSPAEFTASKAFSNWSWTAIDNYYFQHQAGFLPDETWHVMEGLIRVLKDNELGRAVFEERKWTFRQSFIELVEEMWQESDG